MVGLRVFMTYNRVIFAILCSEFGYSAQESMILYCRGICKTSLQIRGFR